MKQRVYCLNHPNIHAVNTKKLCSVCTKERHEKSALSKGFTIKKKDNGIDSTRERDVSISRVQSNETSNNAEVWANKKETKNTFKKTSIKYRSEKGKELAKQELLLFQKLFQERPPSCEYCGTEITVFNPTNYHHVRTKGSHPELRLVESNIVKICVDCHLKEHGFKPRKKWKQLNLEMDTYSPKQSQLKQERF